MPFLTLEPKWAKIILQENLILHESSWVVINAPVILKIPTGLMGGGSGRGFHHCNTIGGDVKGG